MIGLRAGSATDVGRVRSNNQDAFLAAPSLFAVADGMGGAAAGEVASALAVEALHNGFSHTGPPTPDLLVESARAANRAVWDEAQANPEMRGMGTTLVAIALVEGPQLAIINIGDSRLYLMHDGDLRQITFDHNLVAEMVAEGRITPAEAEVHPRRNIMTRALGVEPEVPIDLFVEDPVPGDRYLLCSDGLPREVNDDLIRSLLARFADPADAAKELVDEAKRRGGNDNITVVVVDVVDDPADGAVDRAAPAELGGSAGGAGGAAATDGDVTTTLAAADLAGPSAPSASASASASPSASASASADHLEQERAPARPGRPIRSALTLRVVGFILVLLIILGGAAAGIVWYARSSYYVGLRGNLIVIYQGRPGGVLGLNPTLKETTGFTTAQVLPSAVPALKSGQEESSVPAARQYVQNLVNAYDAAQAAAAPPTTLPSPTTTVPRTSTTARP